MADGGQSEGASGTALQTAGLRGADAPAAEDDGAGGRKCE